MSTIFNLCQKVFQISTLTWKLDKNIKNITIIGANTYCMTSKLKNACVFSISIKYLKFQISDEA